MSFSSINSPRRYCPAPTNSEVRQGFHRLSTGIFVLMGWLKRHMIDLQTLEKSCGIVPTQTF